MKKKILGILICILLITSILPVIGLEKENDTAKHSNYLFEIEEDTSNIIIDNPEDLSTIMLDQLDQQSTQSDNVKKIGASDKELAQSFKPTYPTLTRVILRLKSTGTAEYYYYYVDIKNSLIGSALTTAYISRNLLVIGTGLYEFNFPDISVTPGKTYHIVLRGVSTSVDSSSVYWWYGYPDPYANGAAWYESISGWNYLQEGVQYCDYCFQTYGEEPGNNPPNTPSTPLGTAYEYRTTAVDPDGDDVQVRFDWDGSYSSWSPLTSSGTTFITTNSWSIPGTYQIKAQAKDEHGATSSWSSARTVVISGGGSNNPPNTPSVPSGPTSGSPGTSYAYDASATDPDGDQVKYYFDWDDGSGDWTGLGASGSSASLSHVWAAADTYEVKVKAQDEHGAESGWSTVLTVTISDNAAPDKPDKPSGPTTGTIGISYTYSASAVDPNGDQVYLMFDWADGTDSGWLGPYNSGDPVSSLHIWSAQGSYSVRVKAKDTSDAESMWSDPLAISMPLRHQILLEQIIEWILQLFGVS